MLSLSTTVAQPPTLCHCTYPNFVVAHHRPTHPFPAEALLVAVTRCHSHLSLYTPCVRLSPLIATSLKHCPLLLPVVAHFPSFLPLLIVIAYLLTLYRHHCVVSSIVVIFLNTILIEGAHRLLLNTRLSSLVGTLACRVKSYLSESRLNLVRLKPYLTLFANLHCRYLIPLVRIAPILLLFLPFSLSLSSLILLNFYLFFY